MACSTVDNVTTFADLNEDIYEIIVKNADPRDLMNLSQTNRLFNKAVKTVKSLYPNYSVGEAAKELGDRWNKVTAEQKAKYEAQVQADKGRYEQELAKYKAGL